MVDQVIKVAFQLPSWGTIEGMEDTTDTTGNHVGHPPQIAQQPEKRGWSAPSVSVGQDGGGPFQIGGSCTG